MPFADHIEPLLRGDDLLEAQAAALMEHLISDHASDGQRGAVLGLLRAKGVTGEELGAFATVLRGHSMTIETHIEGLVDTCGTGGGPASFNLSTAAMFVAAGAGVTIAKHGNRAVTSKCGSADVLEALGVTLPVNRLEVVRCLKSVGIAFMLAPSFHPAMKVFGPVRRELGFRTVFNVLGPLLNPAGATRQLIGVYDRALVVPVAQALHRIGVERGLVVHAESGHDEISPAGRTYFARAFGGQVVEGEFTPRDFGLNEIDPSALEGGETAT